MKVLIIAIGLLSILVLGCQPHQQQDISLVKEVAGNVTIEGSPFSITLTDNNIEPLVDGTTVIGHIGDIYYEINESTDQIITVTIRDKKGNGHTFQRLYLTYDGLLATTNQTEANRISEIIAEKEKVRRVTRGFMLIP